VRDGLFYGTSAQQRPLVQVRPFERFIRINDDAWVPGREKVDEQ